MPAFDSDRHPPSCILFQNPHQDVTLVDIPASISTVQGRSATLLSTTPLELPYQLHREQHNSQSTKNNPSHLTLQHIEYRSVIHAALAEIRSHIAGPWCLPRKLMNPASKPQGTDTDMQPDDPEREIESRLQEWSAPKPTEGGNTHFDLQKMMASLSSPPDPTANSHETVARRWSMSYESPPEDTSALSGEATSTWTPSFHNSADHPLNLHIREDTAQHKPEALAYQFTIPPRASFFLMDSAYPQDFRAAFRELTDQYRLPRHFDLVLLDPPWPNRSARRKGAYETMGGMPHMKKMLLKMDIDNYLEHNALVGVWITNKEALRTLVLGPGGLFEAWNVGLVEEWIWVKVTTKGEPMFDIDGLMRKPFEVLLLGRAAPNGWTKMEHTRSPRKKVIAAVPDVHSRKPCLKELLEPYMPDVREYGALEIFARNLVTGWTSWGNEVIKFNWERYWTSEGSL